MNNTKCPFCAEEIQADAIKCRFCGEWLNHKTDEPKKLVVSDSSDKKVHAKQHSSYTTFTVLALLIPFIGFIVGIVYLTKGELVERKLGEHIIVMSIVGVILGFFLWSWIL